MNILHVIPAVAPRYGGPSQAVIEMCRTLQGQGIEPIIATTDADNDSRLPVELEKHLSYKGVSTIFFSRQWSEAFKYSWPLACWLESNVKRYDVVHIHSVFSHSSLAAARACRRYEVPYVVRPLGTLDPWCMKQKGMRKRLIWHLAVKKMMHGAAAVHYTTLAEQQAVEDSLGLRRGVVIPLGINMNLLATKVLPDNFCRQYPALKGNPYVLLLGRIHPKKGLELFLDVFLELTLKKDFSHWRIVLAGEGRANYVDHLKHLVQERDGEDRVIFVGWLSGAEKVAALKGAALLALPSHQENFGIAVVEAMACAIPVLVSRQVNLSDDIEAVGAGWVTSLERRLLSQSLARALQDKDERILRGSAGLALVRSRFTWPVVISDMVKLYECLSKPNRRLKKHGYLTR